MWDIIRAAIPEGNIEGERNQMIADNGGSKTRIGYPVNISDRSICDALREAGIEVFFLEDTQIQAGG
jgi:hypothetical protein